MKEREEERREVDCKFTVDLDTRIKKLYMRDKWGPELMVKS
jgi:hypothetical protein